MNGCGLFINPVRFDSLKDDSMCLGIPGQIVEITDPHHQLAMVNVGGVKRQVNIACVIDEAHPIDSCVGDWVLIHVGFALNRLDPEEAAETLNLLQQLAVAEDVVTF